MAFESILRDDILRPELLADLDYVKVTSDTWFNALINNAVSPEKDKTPGDAKSIIETQELIRNAIVNYEERTDSRADREIDVVYNKPDKDIEIETISMLIHKREPGIFAQGRPFEGKTRQLRPLLREEVEDPDHPGYKRAVLGKWYDNILRLTCWARTNKTALDRALWLENVMEQYTWYFRNSGVNRIFYHGWPGSEVININNVKYYGVSIDYYVKTEKLHNVSQKKLEQICVKMATVHPTE